MFHPIRNLGSHILNASQDDGAGQLAIPPQLSRRGFLLLTAALSSCSVAAPLPESQPATPARKTAANTKYRTPTVAGPVPRNPDNSFSNDFSGNTGLSFSRVKVPGNYIAMTFDDGPHPHNTPRLLDMLRARNIKATFFVVGNCVDLYPQVVRRTVAEGHEIGNHSYTHRLLTKCSDAEMLSEISRCRDAVLRAANYQQRVLRPPYGSLTQRQRELVHSTFGFPSILWSVDPLDWKRPGPSVVTSRILAGTTAGAIILAHDLHAPSVDAMPATLDGLLARGFQFVTVSQLLAMKSDATTAQAAATKKS